MQEREDVHGGRRPEKIYRSRFRRLAARLDAALPAVRQELVDRRDGPACGVETPVVCNGALEDAGPGNEIKLWCWLLTNL